jgi:short-subunit dehydrogenase
MPEPRTVVVAGASSGMGKATALAFARTGARLFLLARRQDALEEAAHACEGAGSPRAVAIPGDVVDPAALEALAARAMEETGRIDVWVNMAGVGAVGPFEQVPLELHRRIVDTNLVGAMNGCWAVLPHMLARDRGVIINMVSIGARLPQPFAAAYTASKWGLAGFTDALRHEVLARSRVQVCGVYPAIVDTPAVLHAANYTGRAFTGTAPVLAPAHVAARIVALAGRPRRALNIGAMHAMVPGFWLAPDAFGQAFARMMRRAFQRGPRAPRTDGALLAPIAEGTGTAMGWGIAAQQRLQVQALGVALGLVALGGLLAGARRALHGR